MIGEMLRLQASLRSYNKGGNNMPVLKKMYLKARYREEEKYVEFCTLQNRGVFKVSYEAGFSIPVMESINKKVVTNQILFGTGRCLVRKSVFKDNHGKYHMYKTRVHNLDIFYTTLVKMETDGNVFLTRMREYNNASMNDRIGLAAQQLGILYIHKREELLSNPSVIKPGDKLYDVPDYGYSMLYCKDLDAFRLFVDKVYWKDPGELLYLIDVKISTHRHQRVWAYDEGIWVPCAPILENNVEYTGDWRKF